MLRNFVASVQQYRKTVPRVEVFAMLGGLTPTLWDKLGVSSRGARGTCSTRGTAARSCGSDARRRPRS